MIHEPNAPTGCRWRPTSAYFATSQADRLDEIASVEEKEVTLPQLAMSEAYEIAEEVHERWRYVLGFRGEAEAPPQEEEPAPVIRSAQLSGRPAESAAPAPTGRVAAVTRVGAAPIIPLEDTALAGSERVTIDIGGQMMAEVMTEVRANLTTKSAAVSASEAAPSASEAAIEQPSECDGLAAPCGSEPAADEQVEDPGAPRGLLARSLSELLEPREPASAPDSTGRGVLLLAAVSAALVLGVVAVRSLQRRN